MEIKQDTKVKVISTVLGSVTVVLPNLNWQRIWANKGATVMVPYSILEEGMFDPGFNYMLTHGDLYIEDMDVKKALGLEPDDAKEPENIIVLNENKMIYLLKTASIEVLQDQLDKISLEQANNLVDYAIEHQLNDFDKAAVLKKRTGRDITKSILLKRENEVE